MLYRTFAEAFPHVMVFYHNFDTFLVGSGEPLQLSPNAFQHRLVSDRLARDLAASELLEPEDLFSAYLMGRDAALEFAGDAPVVTDDLPMVEFTAPKAVETSTTATNYLGVTRYGEPVTPLLRGKVSEELLALLEERFQFQKNQWKSAREKAAERASRIPEELR
jgi:spermidine synthase